MPGCFSPRSRKWRKKGGRVFVGVNAGFNIHPEPAFYRLPLAPVPAVRRAGPPRIVTIAGNINEALDLWAEDVALPPVAERDMLGFLNAGGYGASMASRHCLRTEMKAEFFLPPRRRRRNRWRRATCKSSPPATKKAWDSLYASTAELVWGREPLPFSRRFHRGFPPCAAPPSRLLDAGAGEAATFLSSWAAGLGETHALDASSHALEKIPPALLKVRLQQADLDATGLPDAHFDGITILDVIETLPDTVAVLRELHRILKPGGLLLLCNIPGMEDGVAGIDMQAIGQTAFLYRKTYYFQFIERREAELAAARAGFELLRCCHCQWVEQHHPGFRTGEHMHLSQIFSCGVRLIPPECERSSCKAGFARSFYVRLDESAKVLSFALLAALLQAGVAIGFATPTRCFFPTSASPGCRSCTFSCRW